MRFKGYERLNELSRGGIEIQSTLLWNQMCERLETRNPDLKNFATKWGETWEAILPIDFVVL